MSSLSTFESRTGKLEFSAEKVYNFVTDIRNFKRFIPGDTVNNIDLGPDFGSFQAGMLGTVTVTIAGKTPFSQVTYSGNVFRSNDYTLTLNISDKGDTHSEVKVRLTADLNPMLKMIASEPARKFLDTLISEMEKFREW